MEGVYQKDVSFRVSLMCHVWVVFFLAITKNCFSLKLEIKSHLGWLSSF